MEEKKQVMRFAQEGNESDDDAIKRIYAASIDPTKGPEPFKPQQEFVDPEKKEYLVLYIANDRSTDEEIKSFEFITGRTEVYKFIKGMIESIDIHESKVLVETRAFKDGIASVYDFMEHASQFMNDDIRIDIEEYNIE